MIANSVHKPAENELKDGRAKIFQLIDFFTILPQTDNELLVSEMPKKMGVTDSVSEIKRVENYPDFENLTHLVQHGLEVYSLNYRRQVNGGKLSQPYFEKVGL